MVARPTAGAPVKTRTSKLLPEVPGCYRSLVAADVTGVPKTVEASRTTNILVLRS